MNEFNDQKIIEALENFLNSNPDPLDLTGLKEIVYPLFHNVYLTNMFVTGVGDKLAHGLFTKDQIIEDAKDILEVLKFDNEAEFEEVFETHPHGWSIQMMESSVRCRESVKTLDTKFKEILNNPQLPRDVEGEMQAIPKSVFDIFNLRRQNFRNTLLAYKEWLESELDCVYVNKLADCNLLESINDLVYALQEFTVFIHKFGVSGVYTSEYNKHLEGTIRCIDGVFQLSTDEEIVERIEKYNPFVVNEFIVIILVLLDQLLEATSVAAEATTFIENTGINLMTLSKMITICVNLGIQIEKEIKR